MWKVMKCKAPAAQTPCFSKRSRHKLLPIIVRSYLASGSLSSVCSQSHDCLQASLLQRARSLQSQRLRSSASASWTTSTCTLLLHSCRTTAGQHPSRQCRPPLLLLLLSPLMVALLCMLTSPAAQNQYKLRRQWLLQPASLLYYLSPSNCC